MRITLCLIISVYFLFITSVAYTEIGSSEILSFKNGAKAAYTFSFDDGSTGQYQYTVPILDAYNIHGTFFLIGASVEAWYSTVGRVHVPQMLQMFTKGHEIGSHTYNHLRLTILDDIDIHAQMSLNQAYFNSLGIHPVSMAYPYGATDERVQSIVGQYVEFARGGYPMITNASSWDELNPLDLRWSSQSDNHYACVDLAIATNTWAIGTFHQIGSTGGPSVEDFSAFVEYLADLRDKGELYIDTVKEVGSYIRERYTATITSSYNAESNIVKVRLQLGLSYPYIVPLTLTTDIDEYYVKSISQSEMPISYEILNEDFGRLVKYNVIPDGGDVTIELTANTSEQHVVCIKPLKGDLNSDCKVDLLDFTVFATQWLDCNLEPKDNCFE